MNKIILFYKYIELTHPHAEVKQQKKLCADLQLKGRILIAQEGINGTLGGTHEQIDSYIAYMRQHPLFADIDFKESLNVANHFPRLRVVIKNEIVNLGINPTMIKPKDGGIHLTPEQTHELLTEKPSDLLILDVRNEFEYAIGRFEGAIKTPIAHFRDFPAYIDAHQDTFKDKQVLMYCTGGVRCERASAYLQTKKITKKIFQMNGGIHRYIEEFPNGFFKGKNYVFDGRTAVKISEDILGSCYICANAYDEYTNCLRADCNRHFIGCLACLSIYKNMCSALCLELVTSGKAKMRPALKKVYNNHDTSICQL